MQVSMLSVSVTAAILFGVAELADPTAGPLGRQPQPVLDGHPDGAVQLMRGGDHDGQSQ